MDNRAFQKAKLYFQNPLWAEYILTDADSDPSLAGVWEPAQEHIQQKADVGIEAELEIPFTQEEVIVQTPESIQEFEEAQVESEPIAQSAAEPLLRTNIAGLAAAEPGFSATLSFEPYHTVDYFASQGIRFKDEPREKDKFSVQLRSFTEWLKTMKRLPVNEGINLPNISEEKRVVQMAEHSIAPREVVTETMAEVWIKQGNTDKAARVYQKLSLLDPAKSAYFAAKIEQLKHS